ncbi:hypothetical protein [Aromatoleum bremense]|uniref:Uncharacterized protein n=1 Tax=Aromatoleum bremense TaxID=76115 RepID=A0ABX1NV19_9RHOO|nr:hypothetical protein [Aromatoleum bremense]NMG15502.1 hypothetical protein [Aromatoleum bremense]QTQ31541.1 Uncharacterized protein pbN1_15500 [Aromatoleum bremense]
MQNLPRPIASALNRRAHAEALAHEELVKNRLLADVARLKAQGAKPAEIVAYLTQSTPAK